MRIINRKIFQRLRLPSPKSHKGDNGRLLIVAGSSKYHGALLYTVKAASRIVDLIYVLTTPDNRNLIHKLKGQTAEFITITKISEVKNKIDCVLIGPGLGVSGKTKKLVSAVLRSNKKAVLDADALMVLDAALKKLLNRNHILTPHRGEFKKTFGLAPTAANVKKMAKQYGCIIVLKGRVDVVGHPARGLYYNRTGNEGMTKGGTGDVLAGLTAALFCTNDAFHAAAAGVYFNGGAGDYLYKKIGPYYDAEDLTEALPKVLWSLKK
jgi:hydroxyethylthiazole kinase-like uncharacterized protein yjeF